MKRRTFLKTAAGTAPGLWALSLLGAANRDDQAADEEVLSQTKARIRAHRQGTGTVVVLDRQGKAVPGAQVRLEQVRHQFLFGCNCFMFDRHSAPDLESAYRRRFAALLNYATLGFYWPAYEPVRGQPGYAYTDKVVAWCQEQGIACKGHPLVWDFADPRWLPQDFAEIRALSNARVREIVARYAGRIDRWDVVNEPTHLGRFKTRLGEWALSVGAVPYVTEHLKIAREANPRATLLVNDYRTDQPFYDILHALRDNGRLLFDTVGIQSHMHGGGWPLRRVWEVCDKYAQLGVPLHFTETTIVSGPRAEGERWQPTTPEGEAAQAEYVPKFYAALFAHPAVEALTWWDFSDRGAWQGAPAGWLRKDMTPKPVYEKLHALIKGDWWTQTKGATDQNGEFAATAFAGDYRVEVELPSGQRLSREARWQKGSANRLEILEKA